MKFISRARVEETLLEWTRYKQIKVRLIVLIALAVPIGIVLSDVLPNLVHSNRPSLLLAGSYALVLSLSWFQFWTYRCVRCRRSLRGQQLFQDRCSHCGVLINPSRYY